MSKEVLKALKKQGYLKAGIEKMKKKDFSYTNKVTGLNLKQLKKEQENPTILNGRSRAFNFIPEKEQERLEHVVIQSYTGNIIVSFAVVESSGTVKYLNVLDVKKVENPRKKQKTSDVELSTRQIRNRALSAAEMITATYNADNFYVNGNPLSEIELIKDLVDEISFLYEQEYGVREK